MPIIRPSSDLRNSYNEISSICHETNKPIYITKNGAGDLAVMSIELYELLAERYENYSKSEKNIETVQQVNKEETKVEKQVKVKGKEKSNTNRVEPESAHEILQDIEIEPNIQPRQKEKSATTKVKDINNTDWIFEDLHKALNDIKV